MTRFTAAIHCEGSLYVARCLEVDVVSQGTSIEDATKNLREAVELYLDEASPPSVSKTPIIAPLDVDVTEH